ncbi:NAD(P)H-dependent oxidoreductase [Aestuariicoccus sp. MJ-SS9]|uniref:NAD(P)H-dependent oxidoreductase n=1 Tax=Aestuariicoccus sp. MJ-SS9 TaxID=3079855 RepID=UPI00290C5849|nr:NAD(P)H-dependent oxidoreductase [Aestuariicoccus sp. MJ-SS9]MDU8911748.1 NAD(P)H-dependent oxidoreductase [Aestuariicoccus sp. MJ-SS9]
MPRTLIVSAPPGPDSFTAAWAEASVAAAAGLGHDVTHLDLMAEGFDAVERASHYGLDGPFDPLKVQESHEPPADVAGHVDAVRAADLVILHFPIWWFGPPALIKGWCERVLMHGHLHDVDNRFDRGLCRGKTALFCVSTGAGAAEVGPRGKEGRLDLLLWPLAYTLRYCGFDVAAPEAAHGVHGYWTGDEKAELEQRLGAVLSGQKALIDGLPDRPRLRFHADSDFDDDGRLRAGITPLWPFHG